MYIFKHFCIETVSLQISSFPTNQKKKRKKKCKLVLYKSNKFWGEFDLLALK